MATITRGAGDDLIVGTASSDSINGGAGFDTIEAGAGNDSIFSDDADKIDGGDGIDMVVLRRQNSTDFFSIDLSTAAKIAANQILADNTELVNVERIAFYAGSGGSLIYGNSELNNTFVGGSGVDEFHGGLAQDRFTNIGTGDKIYAGGGNDWLEVIGQPGGAQANPAFIDGGTGIDTLRVLGPARLETMTRIEKVEVVAGSMTFDAVSGAGDKVTFQDVYKAFEPLPQAVNVAPGLLIVASETTQAGAAVPTGQSDGVNILGTWRADTIYGSSASDHIDGNRGNDTIYGGGGDDYLTDGSGLGTVYGEDGNDSVFSVNPDGQDLLLDGGAGFDFARIERTALTTSYIIDVSGSGPSTKDNKGMTVVNFEVFDIQGGSGDDRINTGAGDDLLVGNAGSDILNAGAGNDILKGGAGNDELFGGVGTDYALYSGAQTDYNITKRADGVTIVRDLRGGSPDGTDYLTGIEFVTFDNKLPNQGADLLLA